ncbi:tyrosine-protein phosphatase [Pediococcus ethanolidurans]|uniref:tyrosine-protein phosphatase n=1 Tax=Pediococcus ethanolidurans TaxID=319653 RepID=UPI0029534A89|nr:tyrosine-protein phosphatase [Pediococcus ethanolidurans]
MEKQRVLPIQSGLNFRELGGYPTKDGKTIKWQKILRSGYLSVLTKKDQNYLLDYGLRYVVDLRSDYEITRNPDPRMTDVQQIPASVYPFSNRPSTSFSQFFKRLFHKDAVKKPSALSDPYELMVLDSHAQGAFRKLFQALLKNEEPNKAVLFHCAAGKDRTGIAAFLILSALGVDQKTIEEDYLLSNKVLFGTTTVKTEATNNTAINRMNQARNVDLHSLRLAAKAITSEYGDMINYLNQAMVLSNDDIAELKRLYTE